MSEKSQPSRPHSLRRHPDPSILEGIPVSVRMSALARACTHTHTYCVSLKVSLALFGTYEMLIGCKLTENWVVCPPYCRANPPQHSELRRVVFLLLETQESENSERTWILMQNHRWGVFIFLQERLMEQMAFVTTLSVTEIQTGRMQTL